MLSFSFRKIYVILFLHDILKKYTYALKIETKKECVADMKRKLTAERRNELAQILLSEGSIKVGEIAEKFNVSTETIRKDIIYLEKEKIAIKSHGGAIIASNMLERSVELKKTDNTNYKAKIALKALSFIPENATIILDAGSTNYALAKLLSLEKGLTIFTNSILALNVLTPSDHQVFVFGGMTRASSYGIVGKWTNEEIQSIRADIAFIGTDGFQGLHGPATASYEEAEFKNNIVKASDKTFILSDSSKFHNRTLFEFCKWEDIDALITDQNAPKDDVYLLKQHTDVIFA